MTESSPDVRRLKELNAQLAEAEVKRDVDQLERILDDDYLGVDPSGALLTKEKIVKTYGAGEVRLESIVSSDLRIRVLGDTGIITGRSLIKGNTGSGDFMALFRYTDTYRKMNGDWQLVASQLTPLVAEGPMLA